MNATINRMPENINFLTDIKFSLSIQRLKDVQYFCQSVNIPGCYTPPVDQGTPYIPQKLQGDTLHYSPFKVSFLVDEYLNNYWSIYKWKKGITFPDSYSQYKALVTAGNRPDFGELYSDITLNILSNKQIPICMVHFKECWPSRLDDLNFTTTRSDEDPIQCSVEFAFTSFDYEQLFPVEGVGSAENVL